METVRKHVHHIACHNVECKARWIRVVCIEIAACNARKRMYHGAHCIQLSYKYTKVKTNLPFVFAKFYIF